ncbi:hypothetical protein RSAG8_12705, partial [Rhizoctonia solani AG-8 WAC10335]
MSIPIACFLNDLTPKAQKILGLLDENFRYWLSCHITQRSRMGWNHAICDIATRGNGPSVYPTLIQSDADESSNHSNHDHIHGIVWRTCTTTCCANTVLFLAGTSVKQSPPITPGPKSSVSPAQERIGHVNHASVLGGEDPMHSIK